MPTPLRVLIVEDSEDDTLLLVRELERGGHQVTFRRVMTRAAMQEALRDPKWDLVLSDFAMPHLDALAALAVLKESGRDLPFIIASGSYGEEAAVAALKGGAHDFVSKDRLARLVPAVQRELREAELRREQRELREQLLVADRLVSMGTLAAGVAHEIHNPLHAAVAYLEIVVADLQTLERSSPHLPAEAEAPSLSGTRELVGHAKAALDRVGEIVRDVSLFSRSGDAGPHAPIDLRSVVDSALRLAVYEVRQRARLVKEYGDAPLVMGHDGRLGQVFLNLIINAVQAIPEGRAQHNEIRLRIAADGSGRAVVEVRDTGCGIPADHLPHVFDAFFTTKPPGVGTGLGLAICHRIVADLGGSIVVESRPAEGTCVRVTLPPAPLKLGSSEIAA